MDDGKVNVFSIPMLRSLHEAFDQAERDQAVVLLKGRPGCFTAGFDLQTLGGPHRDVVTILRLGASLAERILSFPAPVTVACTGHAFPAGAFLLMAADARVGADGPFLLGLNEVRIGLTLPWFAVVLARHRLTPAHFDHAAVTGEMFDPKTARGAGLLDAVVPPAELDADRTPRCPGPRLARSRRRMLRPSCVSANRSSTSCVLPLRPSWSDHPEPSGELDTRPHSTHDQRVGFPSLLKTMIRLPGDLLRLPSSTLAALDAVNDVADRMDRLTTLLERLEGGVNRAGSGIDLAALGISSAVSGLEQAVGMLDSSLPSLSDSASALRFLTERLSGAAIELANELPKATRSLQEVSPELASVAGLLDERFTHLDTVVTELAGLMESVFGTIPGMRRVLRTTSSNTPFEPN